MKILKDSIFKIGKAHSVCQDYASHLSLSNDMIAVSDGCSSSENTDFGSRILIKRSQCDDWWLGKDLPKFMERCENTVASLFLENSCLDATLLLASIEDNKLKVKIYGDGVFSYRLKDDTIKIVKIEFANNAPYYLSYEISPERKKNYLEIFGGKKTITVYTVTFGNTDIEYTEVAYNEKTEFEFDISTLKSFFLFSDGVETFHQVIKTETYKFTKDIPVVDSVLEIMNCPTFGPFLEKKYTKLSEQHAKQGIFHSDDLSVAAFLFQEDL
jgi:hypothetical protein